MKVSRLQVYVAINGERDYQDSLDHTRTDGCAKGVGDYLTLIRSYLREAEEGWTRTSGNEKGLHSVRKIAAIAVHCMEANGAPERERK